MKNARLVFDSPDLYDAPEKYYVQGSSPTILKEIIEYLKSNKDQISEINASLYLYNNPVLHHFFKELSEKGIKINIVSIPLEGYDNSSPKNIVDLRTNDVCFKNKKITKYHIAKYIYSDFREDKKSNFNMYIFPHMYLRSPRVRRFSRGNMPYSLHIKSFYIKFKNNKCSTILTSSNLAVRDKIKDEIMIILEGNYSSDNNSEMFFSTLLNNSISIHNFNERNDYSHYDITQSSTNFELSNNNYLGPFINDSQTKFENHLKQLIKLAKHRILICGQHVSAYKYNDGYRERKGFLSEVIDKSQNDEIQIKILSQTFVDEQGHSHNQRKPSNIRSFKNFIENYNITDNHLYAVNNAVHSKFIIVDNIALITSCNFTPTQFIYLANVDIPKFNNIPNISYSGIHSEVGMYTVIKSEELCNKLIAFFDNIWTREDTYHHLKP